MDFLVTIKRAMGGLSDEKNSQETLFTLGAELSELELKREKLCSKLGNNVYKTKGNINILNELSEIKSIDIEIEEKRKELSKFEIQNNLKGEQEHEKNS